MEHIFQNWPQFRLHPPAEDLLQKFQNLREATVTDGRSRHSKKVVDKTILVIATQNYSMHIYSLCHLLAALSAAKVEYEILYDFKSTITKQTIEQLFVTNFQTSAFKVKNDSIEFACKSGSVWFAYSLAQGPLSLCLFDFLNESVGILELKNAYHHLGASPTQQQVRTISNQISKKVYSYLKDRLPTSSAQDKAVLFASHIRNLSEGRHTKSRLIEIIDDDMIFEFWDLNKHNEKLRLKLYSSCVLSWANYRQALSSSNYLAFEPSENSNDDASKGKPSEIDKLAFRQWGEHNKNQSEEDETVFPENYLTATSFDTFFEEQSNLPLDYLDAVSSTSLKETKFLNNKEVGIVEGLCQLGPQAKFIFKSEFRMSTFSPIQSQLVQKQREKSNTKDVLNSILKVSDELYFEHKRELEQLANTCEELALTGASRLCEAGYPFGLTTLQEAFNEQDRQQLNTFLKEQAAELDGQTLSIEDAKIHAAKLIEDLSKSLPDLSSKMKNNLKKYRRHGLNKRKKQDDKNFHLWCEEIVHTVPKLLKLSEFIKNTIKVSLLPEEKQQLSLLTAEDKNRFFTSFRSLYGETDEYQQS